MSSTPDGVEVDPDAEADASEGEVTDVDGQPVDGGDASRRPPGAPCESAAECDDGLFCNGGETCEPAPEGGGNVCRQATVLPCTREHPCLEERDACDCSNPDVDGDGDSAKVCEGDPTVPPDPKNLLKRTYTDCDDGDETRCGTFTEQCDDRDNDEDCNTTTFGERDQDGDGYIDTRCRNYDSTNRKYNGGDDCNDNNPSIHPKASEVCDYVDNNCNDFVDERLLSDGAPEHLNGGLREQLLPDEDGDRHGRAGAVPLLACAITEKNGYVPITEPQDCDDTNPGRYFGAIEVCDGIDNDCDDKVDSEDGPLTPPYTFSGTKLTCERGDWIIKSGDCPSSDVLWCEGRDPIDQGCRTDATRLSSCRACGTQCTFSCGPRGCDGIAKVAVGGWFACGLTEQSRVACWGRAFRGRLGNDEVRNSSLAVFIESLEDVRDIALGFAHACAVVGPTHQLTCWGNNATGQLGSTDIAYGPGAFSAVPTDTVGVLGATNLTGVVSVALADEDDDPGFGHTCVVLDTGELSCWGQQADGRLSNRSAREFSMPFPTVAVRVGPSEMRDIRLVAVGAKHGCVVTRDSTVECWGDNSFGQLGDGTLVGSPMAKLVAGVENVQGLAAGRLHTCALANGRVLCWGDNSQLQLGRAPGDDDDVPRAVEGLPDVTAISAAETTTCALTVANEVWCWGGNESGELGTDDQMPSATPIKIALEGVRQVAMGTLSACALTDRGVACWGDNGFGQLGNGQMSRIPQIVPTLVAAEREARP